MPDVLITNRQFVVSNQIMADSGTLVHESGPRPPQPIGNTPLWCKSTPNGSNDQIFYETSTGDAVYFPDFNIAYDDGGRPKVKFARPDKTAPDVSLTITLEAQKPDSAQTANAGGATLKPCPPAYYASAPGQATATGQDTTAVRLDYNNGMKSVAFDEVTSDPATGNIVACAKKLTGSTLNEVLFALVNNVGNQHAAVVITRTIVAVGIEAGTAPEPNGPPRTPLGPPTWVGTVGPIAPVASVPDLTAERPDTRTFTVDREVMRPAVESFEPRAAATTEAFQTSSSTVDRAIFRPPIDWFPPRPMPPTPLPTPPPNPYPPGTKLYTIIPNQQVKSTIPDVWFNQTLAVNADIIGDVGDAKPKQAGYVQQPLPGYDHPVFKDVNDPSSFYYVPEAFKIARSPAPPFLPLFKVTVTGTKLDDAQATISFTAAPVVDRRKLDAAVAPLQAANPDVTMRVLPTPSNIQWGLFLPGVNPAFVNRTAPVALDKPLSDLLPQLSLDQFQAAFSALTVPASQYMQGIVRVPYGDNQEAQVPLIARADDFPGLYFTQTRSVDNAHAAIALVLTNSIESPVQIDALPIKASRAGTPVTCSVIYNPPLPARIPAASADHPAGGTLMATITPASGPVDDTLDFVVDQSQCHVVPDAAGLLRAVLGPNVPVKASRPVTVVVPTVLFGSDAVPDKKILIITMSFLHGNTIRFSRPADSTVSMVAPDKPGEVDLTLFDYLVGQATGASDWVKYKLSITYAATGHTVVDSDWRTAPSDDFVLDLP
jgi:hypothetical protein